MIIHADMPSFSQYNVSLNKEMITPQVYMADDQNGIVMTRNWLNGAFVYERKTGTVQILKAKNATG